MKTRRMLMILWVTLTLLVVLDGIAVAQEPAPSGGKAVQAALGTGFTYQGQLKQDGDPVNGTCDFQFILYDAAVGGAQVGSIVTQPGVSVSEGLFTVGLDFGSVAFAGDARWLEIAVGCPAGSGSYTTLSPRQALTAAPYALYAAGAPWSGLTGMPAGFADGTDNDTLSGLSCASGQIAKWDGSAWTCAAAADTTYSAGTGLSLSGTQFSLDTGYTDSRYWKLGGNAGTDPNTHFLGTTDGQPLIINPNGGNVGIGTTAPQANLTLSPGSGFAIEMASPTGVTVNATAGGALSAGTYYFKVVAEDGAGGTTMGSSEVACDIDGFTNNRCTLSWTEVPDASGYRIYKGTSPDGQDRYHTSTTTAFDYDTDAGATSGTVPTVTTAHVSQLSSGASWFGGKVGIGTTAPQAKLHIGSASDDGVYVHSAGSPGTTTSSPAKNGFEVAGAQHYGLFVGQANFDGVHVNSAGVAGVQVKDAGNCGLCVGNAGDRGVSVQSAGDIGVYVGSAGADGVHVNSAADGVYVHSAGSPSTSIPTGAKNGVEIAGAQGHGLYVGQADYDGVYVHSAGSPSTTTPSTVGRNGFEVAGAQLNGLFVGRADVDGVFVRSAGSNGVDVRYAVDAGVYVDSAGNNGVHVHYVSAGTGVQVDSVGYDGVYVNYAGDDGFDCQNAGGTCFEGSGALNYAAFFDGHLSVTGSCAGCVLSAFGRNAGPTALEPGDVVAVRGVNPTAMQNAPAVMEVSPATGSDAVIGVVVGWAEVVKEAADDSAALERAAAGLAAEAARETLAMLRLVPREGPAQPGEYVNIIIDGLAQVKASAAGAPIQEGMRLTAAEVAGHVRPLRTKMLDDMLVTEGAPVLGIALESLEAGAGLIWVLVNPR